MKKTLLLVVTALLLYTVCGRVPEQTGREKTCFQTASPWKPELDLRSDVAIVYGINETFSDRVQSWQERGYIIHFMTGVAWGRYQEYLEGLFDGQSHTDEGQVNREGEIIWHNKGTVPYMVPSESFIAYLKSLVKTAVDRGVEAIHLEEPEFWARAGYSEGFKREWQAYYNEPWQPQHASPDATYRSSKLKYHLYYRVLEDVFNYAKEYGKKSGKRVGCYVPTHTLINYSAWGIVSPEAGLANLAAMDGYIGQVWTGTARTPIYYDGVLKERTFENAYLEYGAMVAMTKPTGRRVYFLTDPIEDNPDYTWEDYRKNYEATFTAQLLYPDIDHYEVMPWPNRIFCGKYRTAGNSASESIPPEYATEILVLIHALKQMPKTTDPAAGGGSIGVLISDTMMFQRFPKHEGYDDPALSSFYGMALPLLKHGVSVQIVQMENLLHERALDGVAVLIMSYANMKPLMPEYHEVIADWVREGGALIYLGRDDDPFQGVREWWNQGEYAYKAPADHLFKILGFAFPTGKQTYRVGRGVVTVFRKNPKEMVIGMDRGYELRNLVKQVLKMTQQREYIQEKNVLHLIRGSYDITAVLDESFTTDPFVVKGPVIDLYDPTLPVLAEKTINPGERSFLYDLTRLADRATPQILAVASGVESEEREVNLYRFQLKGPANTRGAARVYLPAAAQHVAGQTASGEPVEVKHEWDAGSKTMFLSYANDPEGVKFEIRF